MKLRTHLFLALIGCCTLSVSAQGFAKLSANGVKGSIKNNKNQASTVEVIVDKDADMSNINLQYKLLSGCRLEADLTHDFTNPQSCMILKNDGTSKEWIVSVKKLTPAPLPLNIEFSKNNPAVWNSQAKGWVTSGTDESKPTVVRFGNDNVWFATAFEGEAASVSFELKAVSKAPVAFDGEFAVETSADGVKWEKINGFKDTKITTDSQFTCPLKKTDRFVRWSYEYREKLNINLNNISIK